MTDERHPLDVDGPAAPPRRNGELVFEAPWESRVFGLAMALCERELFSFEEFRQQLIAEIAEITDRERWHPTGAAWSYWSRWQRALEGLLAAKGLCSRDAIEARTREYAARPHRHDH